MFFSNFNRIHLNWKSWKRGLTLNSARQAECIHPFHKKVYWFALDNTKTMNNVLSLLKTHCNKLTCSFPSVHGHTQMFYIKCTADNWICIQMSVFGHREWIMHIVFWSCKWGVASSKILFKQTSTNESSHHHLFPFFSLSWLPPSAPSSMCR